MQLFNFKSSRRSPVLRPDPVFILGMHRSGTSALGGVLEPLGLTVGKTVMPPHAEQGNPKGYYENLPLTQLHDKFLASFGSYWHDCQPVGEERFLPEVARPFREELLRLLIEEFGMGRPLIKDPRMCRLMPLWLPLIKEHFPKANFILPIRHPVEVAYSLRRRDNLTLEHGLRLWVVHVIEAERTTRKFSRRFTTYDQLMQSPVKTVMPIAKRMGLSKEAVSAAVSTQLDASLRHHSEMDWPAGEPHREWILAIHRRLVSKSWVKKRKLDALRDEYYHAMHWPC